MKILTKLALISLLSASTLFAFENERSYVLNNGKILTVTEIGDGPLRDAKVVITDGKTSKSTKLSDIDPITEIRLTDMDGNGWEELFIISHNEGSGTYGSLNILKTYDFSRVLVPKINKFKGYMGHDKYSFENDRIIWEFPIFEVGDTNAKPSGKTIRTEYTIKQEGNSYFLIAFEGHNHD